MACGSAQCLAGTGYMCTAANTAVSFPEACAAAADAGVVDPGSDAGPPPDDRGPGEPCELIGDGDDCADGLTCLDGACASLCSATDYTGCSRAESCNIPIDATYNACSPSCDLVTTDGCPQGTTCGVFGDASGAVYKDCNTAGTGAQGESCDSSSPCAPGHVCAYWSDPPFLSGFECLQLCDLRGIDGPECPEGTTCSYAPNEIEPFGTVDQVGACR